MVRPASKYPTELELEILKALWEDAPLPVRDVRDRIAGFRDLAYTSVSTVLNIMTEKGYLKRTRRKNVCYYKPLQSREATVGAILTDVVNRVFDGSAAAVVVNLLEQCDVEGADLERLRALVNRMEKGDGHERD